MKKLILISLITLFFYDVSYSQELNNYSKKHLIIKFKAESKFDKKNCLVHQKFNNSVLDSLNKASFVKNFAITGIKKEKNTYVLNLNKEANIKHLIKLYLATNLFEYVEPNYIGKGHGVQTTPNDALFYNRQWSHFNDGTFSLIPSLNDADIDTDLAWDITQGDSNLIVAVLDSGLKLDHPEFSNRIWINSSETQNGSDSDGNGFIDDVNAGWDFANNDNNPTDDHGHGTNVTGIALATGNNNIGYSGVNWNSKIMICKVLRDDNFGLYTWFADGIIYAVDNGADVINMSIGGNDPSNILEDAVNYAFNNNVALVVSAGNQNSVIQYPAKYTNAIAIGSTNSDDNRSNPFFWSASSGSNFGPELDFVAPGNYIYGLDFSSNTNYNTFWGGTSQAAPHVAGVISLLLSVNSNLTVTQIRTILEETSEDQVGSNAEDTMGWDQFYGHGRINAFNALNHQILGINDFNPKKHKVLVYPNPVTSINDLIIDNIDPGEYQILIYNILGQKQYQENLTNIDSKITLSIPKLAKGTYFVKITNHSKRNTTTKKIIIR